MRFFPEHLDNYVKQNLSSLFELRLRKDKPVIASINGKYDFISYKGNNIITCSDEINKTVFNACENSIYIYNDCIKNGYVTTKDGIRIGLCGRCIYNNESMVTITDFSSLCVRFPHQIKDCSLPIFNLITADNSAKSTLIISPPGVGKTTAIRDLARQISNKLYLNVLIVDEKHEIYSDGFDLGLSCDTLLGCTKKFGFYNAIKNFSPNVIIVDELVDINDAHGVEFAKLSGVSVIATTHANSFENALKKDYIKALHEKGCFDYYITLKRGHIGFEVDEVIKAND